MKIDLQRITRLAGRSRPDQAAEEIGAPPEVVEAFREVGAVQRGEPEMRMTDAQKASGGGVWSYAIEQVGDLTHRMTEWWPLVTDSSKLPKALNTLREPYGFRREAFENFQSNARYSGRDYNEMLREIIEAGQKYADAHREVPVYNRALWLAREAAIALGEFRFKEAEDLLTELERGGKLEDQVREYEIGPDGKPVLYKP